MYCVFPKNRYYYNLEKQFLENKISKLNKVYEVTNKIYNMNLNYIKTKLNYYRF